YGDPGISLQKSTVANHGSESLEFVGCGWADFRSRPFSASVFEIIGNQLLLDLALLPGSEPYSSHIGFSSRIRVSIRSDAIGFWENLLDAPLVSAPTGEFIRQAISLSPQLQQLLAADTDDL